MQLLLAAIRAAVTASRRSLSPRLPTTRHLVELLMLSDDKLTLTLLGKLASTFGATR